MKLGYGIRLVDLDKHGNILDMIWRRIIL
jgi:hypothetical protein